MTSTRHRGVLLDPLTIAAIKKARAQGTSPAEIARALGVSKASVYSHSSPVAGMPPAQGKRVPCPNCGTPKRRDSVLCRRCNERSPGRAGWAMQGGGPSEHRNGDTPIATTGKPYWHCAVSPTGAHQWELDAQNRGVCQYCPEEREFKTWLTNTPQVG